MPRTAAPQFRKSLIALAVGTALSPSGAWAVDLVQSPPLPTSKSAFVAPNVIISIDDSGSMGFRLDQGSTNNATNNTTPNSDKTWPSTSRRMNVLKYALTEVFSDPTLVPDGKIRLGWQAMWNNGNNIGTYGELNYWYGSGNNPGYGKTPGANNINSSSSSRKNYIRPLDSTHRKNFLDFVSYLLPQNGTPSHLMFKQADEYMRAPLSSTGPWSSNPGGTGSKSTEYLGCRRNYHIMMTDGRWNGTISGGEQDGTAWPASGKRQAYNITTSDQTLIYRDTYSDTLADWAFKSWMDPLQTTGLTDADKLKPSQEYEEAPPTETFSSSRTTPSYEGEPCKGYSDVCVSWRSNGTCRRYETQCTGGWTTYPAVTTTKSVNLQKYWNPKYNPATWPHMVTFTIGFSNDAIRWPGAPNIIAPDLTEPVSEVDKGGYFGYNKGFADLVTGWETWPQMDSENKRSLDLWHAAINGRGRFYPISKGEDLEKAFRAIIGKINEDSAQLPEKILSGGGTTGYSVAQNNAGLFSTVYEAKKGWKGYVMATSARPPEEYACPTKDDPNKTCFRFEDAVAGWKDGGVAKTTADRLDAADFNVSGRLVLTWNDVLSKGVPFKWASDANFLSAAQKASIGVESTASGATVKTKGENILNFIRGDMTLQGKTEDKPFRERESRQGDIVNSEIWYTGNASSLPMLYVGGNDGMLHGFSAKNGEEKIAYVPRGVIPDLKKLADPDYTHRYYVDGSPMTGNIKDGSTDKTMLVGTLGAGGKGYFVLDVTNPATFSESGAASIVQIDRTRPNCDNSSAAKGTALCNTETDEEKDIGNITAQPTRNPNNLLEALQISRMNNGRWAAVMGNGYNSTNQRPVLLIQYLDGDKELVRIQTTTKATGTGLAADNGLASPTLVDLNGDKTVDIVYAGDNLGNLWKFDLTSGTSSDWKAQWGTEKPLFTARGPKFGSTTRDQVQPITAPPIAEVNDRRMEVTVGTQKKEIAIGGMMVAFGTGRNLTADDRRTDINQNVQTLYSVLDNTRYRKRTNIPAGNSLKLLEVHPGAGNCTSSPETCVPVPEVVGTLGTSGSPLAKQTIATVEGDYATVNATEELKKTTWASYKGWYLDLPGAGERILRPMQFYDGSNILAVYSQSPAGTKSASSDNINESCVDTKVDTSAGSQWRTLVNIMDGKRPTVQLVDINGDNIFSATDDKNVNRIVVNEGTPVLVTDKNNVRDYTGQNTEGGKPVLGARMPEISVRPGWRQLN